MAPSRRRPRDEYEQDDVGQDEVLSFQEVRSSFQRRKKRARVSIEEPAKRRRARDEDLDQESEPEDSPVEETEDDGPPQTQYEELRDGDWSHLSHIEEDDQYCTQLIQSRHTQAHLRENRVAENGIIESIECVNFMCHERLRVKLGPLLNFVVGENGSGKSAVLTGITICLGGKASATNRGGSLKALIKEGKDTARLTVVLKNEGDGAYKTDLYGKKIIIERQFSRNGSPSFKVKSEEGRTISTKKADVDEITEYFALQVDNPLNILSQDNARQFLNAANATQKYKYWVQGVNLQALDDDYQVVQGLVTETEQRNQTFKQTVEILEKRKVDAKRLLQVVRKNKDLKEKLWLFRQKMIWSQVIEMERSLARYTRDRDQINAEIEEKQQQIAPLEEEHRRITEITENAHQGLEQARESATEFEDKVKEAQEAVTAAKGSLANLQAEERSAQALLTNLKKTWDKKGENVKKEEERLAEVDGGGMARLAEEVEKFDEHIQSLESQIPTQDQALLLMRSRIGDAEREVADMRNRLNQKKGDIQRSQARLRTLGQGNKDVYRAFDHRTRDLLAAIERDQGFRQKPVGPIGLHIQLAEPKWASLIDKYLGNNLAAYVVTNHSDNMRLRNMMRRLNMDTPIITSSSQPLDTTGKEPDAGVKTMLRVMKFDNAICRTPLIIGNSIEQVVLIEDRRAAEEFMFSDEGSRPRNAKGCLTFHDGKRGEGLLLKSSRDGASTEPMQNLAGNPRVQINDASQIALEEETLNALKGDYEGLKKDVDRAARAYQALDDERKRLEEDIGKLRKTIRIQKANKDAVSDKMNTLEGNDTELQDLKAERDQAKEEYEAQGRQFGDIAAKKLEQSQQVQDAEEELARQREAQQQQEMIIGKAERKYSRLSSATTLALHNKNVAYEERQAKEAFKQHMEEKVVKQGEKVQDMTQQALEHSPGRVEIADNETYQSISARYNGISEQLERRQLKQGRTDDEIDADYVNAKKELDKALVGIQNCRWDLLQLKKALGNRLSQWRQFQRSISSFTRTNFEMLLAERNFRGRVVLDHKIKQLIVEVEPDETRRDANGRSTKTLSGGEKSYSSICLLLAIWEAMGSPLRCLDEFDVFMDNVNRAISTKLLIKAARTSVQRQFIFITPNAIEGAQSQLGDDVTIHRLTDPRQRRVDEMMIRQ
ncbi:uncharacterized protein MKZ38_004495 [Zalerion maritima]|uniref:RecF/RecN/SMC N-terminal domain-containing protein n=1 Tax=Zalerion maritima TaxID=339359 RepID=A0AAD5RL81_9PEZI|nr:uncharacterized protein MKZ38_004495 [Zalerion maritima]